MMDFTEPKFLVAMVHGDETGYANHFLLEVDERVWNTIVTLHARSAEMRDEFKAFAEIALSFNGAIVLNDLDELKIPEHVAHALEVTEPGWYTGDHDELREVIAKLREAKEASGNEANDQPVHLDSEELVVTALGDKHWTALCRFRLHNGDETLESCDFGDLLNLRP